MKQTHAYIPDMTDKLKELFLLVIRKQPVSAQKKANMDKILKQHKWNLVATNQRY